MQITYDEEGDVLAINLVDAEYDHSMEIEPDVVIAHLDEQDHVIGLEILDARLRLGPDPLGHISIERYSASVESSATRHQMRRPAPRKSHSPRP